MEDELILLDRARALDNEALTEIHDAYYSAIHRYISLRIGDEQTVEDLTSEVFIRFLSALRDKSAPRNTLRGWLFGVASRVVKEQYRQQKRTQHSELDESLPSRGQLPEQEVSQRMMRQRLARVMERLTEEQRDVLALRFGFEMAIRDVAETMGKSEAAVKMLQARALTTLSQYLAGGGEGWQ